MMTDQEIFDYVVNHVRTQGHAAIKVSTIGAAAAECVFRNEQGDKCAVGCLIPDDRYDPKMEDYSFTEDWNNPVREVVSDFIGRPLDGDTDGLLADLQNAHDNNSPHDGDSFVNGFDQSAADVAEKYGLAYTEPEA